MKFYFEFWQLHIIFFSIQLSKRIPFCGSVIFGMLQIKEQA